jgi:thiamine-phosphate pyrophosphorylase
MRPLPARLLVVTNRKLTQQRPLEDVICAALDGGARWIWFRDRDLERHERILLGARLQRLCARYGATLSVGGEAQDALAMGARALHLPSGGDPAAARGIMGAGAMIGVSAHSLAEAENARIAGADYVTLSPIFETSSKPGYGPALGLAALAAAMRLAIPIVALGGIDAEKASACMAAGADAVAVMGAVMRADSPRDAVKSLLESAA